MQGKGIVVPDEEILEDGVAFGGVAKYPARIKCALLGWMALKDAIVQAVDRKDSDAKIISIVPDGSRHER